ncbi:L-2-hydroxyglutarate oxidase [Legionella taurinensis]|uniref:L-2-hydroxyglutarate oxidase n=1 Tax=Legionella taurinensis TaxID=70611 RepID=A0AB38N8Z3_9GAMM|nr:L-2-hydroxyglutarate oxidase [Legionella taurinensis]MDX1838014.1 L-2-hydroxyglutarate oxidase [Legionella taurinensis]PUT39398.1 L-2-hydroxyglutarate oxidase [Legionella taurinensis]PUT41707.1 L-2-hydroxyglutarate oxidase [Legionella taurinensis]PUT44541.1 L-2-hydroxyglutarate oxidase [Legionella taurinensis]PUT46785.1 L-2-hydroxyglutarate oxidase [Legionella taurinensis]
MNTPAGNAAGAADYLIIGAGIMGLSIARELLHSEPRAKIVVLEKEVAVGLHASGRNSGVLHSGIYYPQGSLKAQVCLQGARLMAAYCEEHRLPLNRLGKVIVPVKPDDQAALTLLHERARANGARVQMLDANELRDIEPEAYTATGQALFSPETAVVDPLAIVQHLYFSLERQGVVFHFNCKGLSIDTQRQQIHTQAGCLSYGYLFNTAGLFADKIAERCGLDKRYVLLPFKGFYYEVAKHSDLTLNHLIYPVPDMNVPFLGVHFTKSISGKIYIGPTAIPAFGRENYRGWQGANLSELLKTMTLLGQHYYANRQGFRTYTHQEVPRLFKSRFLSAARSLVPRLRSNDVLRSKKVGIRAQLYDQQKKELVMDFLISTTKNETHVLNAVSPAFTSAFSFAKMVVNEKERHQAELIKESR